MCGQVVFGLLSLGDPPKESQNFKLKCQPKPKPYLNFILDITFELSEGKWGKY